MALNLVFTPQSEDDINAIFDFIAADHPRRALSYIEDIRQACRNLRHTPLIGTERPDLRPGVRILPLWRRVTIVYELPSDRVRILRIFTSGRDYETIMGGD